MKTIVIYNSQTGFTKRYAQWIAEKTNGECVELNPKVYKDNIWQPVQLNSFTVTQ